VASFTYQDPGEAVVPNRDQMESDASTTCRRARSAVVDVDEIAAGSRYAVLTPDEGAWLAGHHDILCTITGSTPWTGSVLK